jgi:5-methylcytosine-specific restriction endonuclease McrA
MTLRFPKPTKCKRPQPKRIRRRHTIAFKRAAVKAASPGVDPDTWAAICDFYRDALGIVRCAYGCGRPATVQDHVQPLTRDGMDEPSNVVPCCAEENLIKGTQTWTVPRPHPWMKVRSHQQAVGVGAVPKTTRPAAKAGTRHLGETVGQPPRPPAVGCALRS